MTELNVINNKVIILDCDKVYDKKVGNMIKTYDNKFVSKKVISNKKHKLFWRHIFSYLNEESIEMINQYIYLYKMKTEVLQIRKYISCNTRIMWGVDKIVEEVYDCGYLCSGERDRQQRIIKDREEWVIVESFDCNVFDYGENNFDKNCNKQLKKYVLDTNKQSKKLQKRFGMYKGYNSYNRLEDTCIGLLGNGDLCGSGYNEYDTFELDYVYYNRSINRIEKRVVYPRNTIGKNVSFGLCGIHMKKYRHMNITEREIYVDKCYKKLGYEKQNGVLCKVCK